MDSTYEKISGVVDRLAIADCITASQPAVPDEPVSTSLSPSAESKPVLTLDIPDSPLPIEISPLNELSIDQLDTLPMPADISLHSKEREALAPRGAFLNAYGYEVAPADPASSAFPPDPVEDALHKMNDAARLIAAEDPQSQVGARTPRASRLAPFYDISGDIRRDSTPLPRTSYSTQPGFLYGRSRKQKASRSRNSSPSLPDFWPWISEADDDGPDMWSNGTDPLQARRLPGSAKRHRAKNRLHSSPDSRTLFGWVPIPGSLFRPLPAYGRWRFVFMSLIVVALLALALDALLVWLAVRAPHTVDLAANGQPAMTLQQNTIQYGQKVTINIRNFTPNGVVALTRDINVPLLDSASHSLLRVDADGSSTINLTIDNSWDPGIHSLQAEDIRQRFTANATLRVDAGPTRPAQLVLSTANLDLGAGYQGANTVQPLTLQNGGGGSISWSATTNQSWLTLSPSRGEFSDSMQISVGGTRLNLTPQDYTATITISANGEAPRTVTVTMNVRPLPDNVGAVLAVAPATLDFSAVDGGANPADQSLVVRNTGSQPLYWTLQLDTATAQDQYITNDFALDANWLTTATTSGVVPPQSQISVRVSVHSGSLLPGTYTKTLLFDVQKNHKALNAPTPVNVSLTVQNGCGVTLHSNTLYFTAIAGRGNPNSQSLNLMASDGCQGIIPWQAASSAPWLTLAPSHGVVSTAASSVVTANVDISSLKPDTDNTAIILIASSRSTLSIAVDLKVQPTPTPTTPVLGASPLSLNFSATVGQQGLAGQTITLTNTGGSTLRWRTAVNLLASSWLGASPTGGTIDPGQTAQLTVNVSAANLSPGTYAGQIELHAVDAQENEVSGSPQIIAISFTVHPPCTLSAPSSQSLSFTQSDTGTISLQTVTFSASGDCSWPLTWNASNLTANTSWLTLSPASGTLASASDTAALTLGVDSASITARSSRRVNVGLSVTDRNGQMVSGGSSTIQVSLVKPCALAISPSNLSFEVKQGQTSAIQSLSLGTTGACKLPVSWTATGDSWLNLSTGSGSLDTDIGNVDVSANASSLGIGTSNGTITFSAQDSSGTVTAIVTVPVSLTIDGFTLSGTINACSDTSCASSSALSNAAVTLTDSSGNVVATATTDDQGHYSFSNRSPGSYTLAANGSSGGVTYSGKASPVTLSNDASVSVNTFPPAPSPTP